MKYFKELYGLWQIDDFNNFYMSLSPKYNRDKIFMAGEGAGKSGSFFFFSHDDKFVVKTVTNGELKLVKRIMPQYSEYLKRNPDSLLSKMLGLFTVETSKFGSVHIMLMENTVRLKDPMELKFKFDLKGSTVDRVVTGRTYKSTILKDINFLLVKQKYKELTKLDTTTRKRILESLTRDLEFLQGLNLMDYSLLIVIEKCDKSKRELHMDTFEDLELNQGFLMPSPKGNNNSDYSFRISTATDYTSGSKSSLKP
jgi:1-phosphatidylinositol-4-phosphate 5-kinase